MKQSTYNHKGIPNSKFQIPNSNPGFTLLFAVFAAALLLSIGLSIYTIAVKELLLSSAGRESQLAFAAADTGAECALYWDFQRQAFTPQILPDTPYSTTIACGDTTTTVSTGSSYPNTAAFRIDLPAGNCADVTITKHTSATLPTCLPRSFCTVLISSGFNTCDGTNPVRLQRTFRVTY